MNALIIWLLGAGSLVLGLVLFLVLTLASETGYRLGRWRHGAGHAHDSDHTVTATLAGGMLALLAFILGLTINFAQNRFEVRRDLVVAEANHISAAWMSARMVGGPQGEAIGRLVRQYAQTRLEFTRADAGVPLDALNARTGQQTHAIWALASDVAAKAPTPISANLARALSDMFDSAQSQQFAFQTETPVVMLEMMVLAGMLAIGAMGFEIGLRGPRQPVLTSLLLVMWAGGMVITADFNFPRHGPINVDTGPLMWTIQDIDDAGRAPAAPPPIAPPVAAPNTPR